jgi:hypothetical protein
MLSNSDSRPWKIFGIDGNIENEFELEEMCKEELNHKTSLSPIPQVIGTQIYLILTYYSVLDSNCVHTEDLSEIVLVSESV